MTSIPCHLSFWQREAHVFFLPQPISRSLEKLIHSKRRLKLCLWNVLTSALLCVWRLRELWKRGQYICKFPLDIWLLRSRWSQPHRSDPDATEYLRKSLPNTDHPCIRCPDLPSSRFLLFSYSSRNPPTTAIMTSKLYHQMSVVTLCGNLSPTHAVG
jgi:hypothetical protein